VWGVANRPARAYSLPGLSNVCSNAYHAPMGELFWSPARELLRMPNGWKMLRRGRRHSEGAIILEDGTYQVFVNDGGRAVHIGSCRTLLDAAWMLWRAP